MSIWQHQLFKCIQVSCQGVNTCITNLNHLTTVADIINALLDNLSEKEYLTIDDCSLYMEYQSYLIILKTTDFIQDILYHYSLFDIHFKFEFKHNLSSLRFAQRKKILRTSAKHSLGIDPYQQLKIQELVIQKQQNIINQLIKINNDKKQINTRQSRQDEYYKAINNRETMKSSRSLSRVRFRLSTITQKHETTSILILPSYK
ncbi:unnamed protein product [Rotaria sp. Silwood2]|nr:unnamed protein product [Rotaria sp. Silwood2]